MMEDSDLKDAQDKALVPEPLETLIETEPEDVPVTEIDPLPETVADIPPTTDIWEKYDRIMEIMQ